MKKKYEKPFFSTIQLDELDVITTSGMDMPDSPKAKRLAPKSQGGLIDDSDTEGWTGFGF
ncbi:MAG: hypothetical protein J6W35_06750 [Eubacterium sp.]|nr:hypothetical protein [Eubacterium sp.]